MAAAAASIIVVVSLLMLALVTAVRRHRRAREARATVTVDGAEVGLPDAVWAVAAAVGAEPVASALYGADPGCAVEAADTLVALVDRLSPEERADMADRLRRMREARAERELWDLQVESIPAAAMAGTLDALILAAGENSDWVTHLLEQAVNSVDVSHLAVGELITRSTHHALSLTAPDLFEHVVGGVDSVVGSGIDSAVEASIDGVGHTLGAVADAHVPVITLLRAAQRASRSSAAGLDSGRVGENFALDAGLGGGGIAAGAFIGSCIVPGVGTVIGGLIGGLIGKGSATYVKERHLRDAEAVAEAQMERLGSSVGHRWLRIARRQLAVVAELNWCRDALLADAEQARHGLVRPLAHYILQASAEAGLADIAQLDAEAKTWQQELAETAGPDCAVFRGAVLLTRADLARRLNVDASLVETAMDATQMVADERQKLVLAGG